MASVPLVLIGGTTASGKSALGLRVAAALGATVVNGDSQQMFRDLPILTARPSAVDESLLPHALFGILEPFEQPSAGAWMARIEELLARATTPLVMVGGTGLYISALLHGLAPIPPVPAAVRAAVRARWADASCDAIRRELQWRDPEAAARLHPHDRQRSLRAIEVHEATGTTLAAWQRMPRQQPELPGPVRAVALVPDEDIVRVRIAQRLDAMFAAGAVDEVAALLVRRHDLLRLPIAKVHGAREVVGLIEGRLTEPECRQLTVNQVCQYAKRQRTFLRHQLPELELLRGFGAELAVCDVLGRAAARVSSV